MTKRANNLIRLIRKAERATSLVAGMVIGIFIGIYAKGPISIVLAMVGILLFVIAYHFISNVMLYVIIDQDIKELNKENNHKHGGIVSGNSRNPD